ncbi:hypothetical protein BHE74_00038323, partial [Ensete ventricosum]
GGSEGDGVAYITAALLRASRLGPTRPHPSAVGLEFPSDKYEPQALRSARSRVKSGEKKGEMFIEKFKVESPSVRYGEDEIESVYHYETTELVHECRDGFYQWIVKPKTVHDIVFGGWDISNMNLADAMARAKVLDIDLQKQLRPYMESMVPLSGIFDSDFVAANQGDRANNAIKGTKKEQLSNSSLLDLYLDREFKEKTKVDKVIVLWTANTERYSDVIMGLNDTMENLMASVEKNEAEISPSTLYGIACVLENVPFINGSPQNTFVPGIRLKLGLLPTSIVSYNHLGNNDGLNLSAPQTFRSKEISKSNVVDDMVSSNGILYEPGEHPDHVIVIKVCIIVDYILLIVRTKYLHSNIHYLLLLQYVPYVGDSKRAMDEYTSEIFMGGKSTVVLHNTCEDSLLAAPIILDLVLLAELSTRIQLKAEEEDKFHSFHPVATILSYLTKAPLVSDYIANLMYVPSGTPVVNALSKQRAMLENILRACIGLAPENNMNLEYK